ncbi:TRAP transporter substrate-binding protein [Sporosarcina sp. FSL W7-1349]|uniref:TRAP transporter substrate-binding protein n=1 Tax=Sporosarcina sp. FSL W7-1349 TaxID=2921561 RepID=UPI0030F6FB2F
MSKKMLFAFLVIMSLMVLTACGGYSKDDGSTASAEGEADTAVNDSATSAETGNATGNATYKLRLGHQSPEATNIHEYAVLFKNLLEEKTDGEVQVDIFPFRQLGTDRELLEAMQFGTLDFGVINGPPISGFAPETAVVDLPFLFRNWTHVKGFLDSDVRDDYLELTESANLKNMGIMARGFRHITNSKKPLETTEDVKGMTIRVIESPVYVNAYKELGASPQSMNWGDAYTALEQKAIDAQENTMDIIHDENVAEVQDYVSKTGINFVFSFIMASKMEFDKWPEHIQEAVLEAAYEAGQEMTELNEHNESEFEEKLKAKGMEINDFDRNQFEGKFEKTYEAWNKVHGDNLLKKIQEIQ